MRQGRLRALTVIGVSVAALGISAPASGAVPAASGSQHFLVLQTSPTGAPRVYADGPIHAAGRDVVVNDSTDRFVFPRGVVTVVHHPTSTRESYDPKTCVGHARETGTYRLTSGTGAYAHVSGRGTYVVEVYVVGCNENRPPTQISLVINARGPISF